MLFAIGCWAVPKPMESVTNYNMLMVHGAYGSDKGISDYSQKNKRVMKMNVVLNGANAVSEFEYCDNSCPLPGTLKKVTIKTSAPQGGESTVVLEVLRAKQRHLLPMKMFDVE